MKAGTVEEIVGLHEDLLDEGCTDREARESVAEQLSIPLVDVDNALGEAAAAAGYPF